MTTPYYQDEWVTLYHGDCRAFPEWLEADVLVTDPPYGRGWRQGDLHGDKHDGIAGDLNTDVRDTALRMWSDRHGDRQAVVFGDLMLAPPPRTKLVGAWLKPVDAGIRGAMGGVRRDLEAIYLVGRWPSGIGGRSSLFRTAARMTGGTQGLSKRAGGHPHTKPQDVLEELLTLCPAGVVADPFAGGGSVPVACRAAQRRCVAVEVEEAWCEVIAKRLSQDVLIF